ncbi:arsenite efflux transporter metallochaperone ArsD [Methanoplanus limicola]|uniref:Arsenical resistance operon trans-acting repressor ArsD n=1 Tax=Methanoplanus limicola DSM 2279 TaxID=937775 RepID=H1Z1I2_9EURY|nr:arsenite efflux transporter metallochaperone ArsD [Methanoplanus limicola]EHQ36329.1 Arsenical resistance operon trans-acting repressor ArsD [Methanoplanus limicola DSM 2279]
MTSDTVIIYEGALCCSTGVCGPEPDKELIEFNETLKKLKRDYPDLEIMRASLTFNIDMFLENDEILQLVKTHGPEILPITTFNGKMVAQKKYPNYEEFQDLIRRG